MEPIKNNIMILREKMGYSQYELADKLGISRGSVSQWERGVRAASPEWLEKLSKVLGADVSEFYGALRPAAGRVLPCEVADAPNGDGGEAARGGLGSCAQAMAVILENIQTLVDTAGADLELLGQLRDVLRDKADYVDKIYALEAERCEQEKERLQQEEARRKLEEEQRREQARKDQQLLKSLRIKR